MATGLEVRLGRRGADASGAWLDVTDPIGGRHREVRIDAPDGPECHGSVWTDGPWFLDAPPAYLAQERDGDGTATERVYAEAWLLEAGDGWARVLTLWRDGDGISERVFTIGRN